MRHLFLLHSRITYLVARAAMRHADLAPATCAYVLLRGFEPDPDDPVTARLALAVSPTVPLTWRVGTVWSTIRKLDQQVRQLLTGADYALYVPHLDNATARLLFTNPRCRSVSYLEEGTASYIPGARLRHPFTVREHVVRRLFSRGRYPALPHYPPGYAHAYCLDAACFPDLARKTVLPLPFQHVTVAPDPSGQVILVLDAVVEFGIVAPDAFRQALHELFAYLMADGRRRVLYKYHPAQARQPARRAYYETEIFGPWRDRLTFAELAATASLEDIAFSYPTVEFAIISSSVGVYAHFCGRRVVSIARRLATLDARFGARLALMPPIFFDTAEFV